MEKKAVSIAVQLGSSCYRVGCLDNGTILQLPNQFGEDETAAYYANTGTETLYGADAKNYAAINANAVVSNPMKSFCGETDLSAWPNLLTPKIVLRDAIQALLRDTVCNWRKCAEIKAVVASVPEAYLRHNNAEIQNIIRQALPEADAVLTIPKSTAAFLGYALSRDQCEDGVYLVLVIGSFLTELSIFRVEKQTAFGLQHPDTFRFGGQDFDDILVQHCCQHFHTQTGLDIREDRGAMYRLRAHCEAAKRKLSTASVTIVEIPQLLPGMLLKVQVTRKELEEKMVERVRGFMTGLTDWIGSDNVSITAVLVTGGASRIPLIQCGIKSLFPPQQIKAACSAIAHCAAIMGATSLTATFSDWRLFKSVVIKNAELYSMGGIRDAMSKCAPLLDISQILQKSTTAYVKDSPSTQTHPTLGTRQHEAAHAVAAASSVTKAVIRTSEQTQTPTATKTFVRDLNAVETVPEFKRSRLATNFEVPDFRCTAVVTEYVRRSKGGVIKRGVDFILSALGLRDTENYKERKNYRAKLEAYFSKSAGKQLTVRIFPEEQDAWPIILLPGSIDDNMQLIGDNVLIIQLTGKDPRTDRLLDDTCPVKFGFDFPSNRDCSRMTTVIRDCHGGACGSEYGMGLPPEVSR